MDERRRIVNVFLDERSVGRRKPEIEHDRAVAIFDLLEENFFAPVGDVLGPFNLHLSIEENRLRFDVRDEADGELFDFNLPLSIFRTVIKDYFVICESYYEAIKNASPSKIEALDMGRRGIHNEGSETLQERIKEFVDVDFDTARRIFTLICVLHIR